ncbi:MAG: hypothetical protein M3550_03805, partial [Actinomycetota bacterium]|nr:hypothetical protein [Actinomycetota bacterium]
MSCIDFALVLNLHQPAGNLDDLLVHREWEAKEILWALDRIPTCRPARSSMPPDATSSERP